MFYRIVITAFIEEAAFLQRSSGIEIEAVSIVNLETRAILYFKMVSDYSTKNFMYET